VIRDGFRSKPFAVERNADVAFEAPAVSPVDGETDATGDIAVTACVTVEATEIMSSLPAVCGKVWRSIHGLRLDIDRRYQRDQQQLGSIETQDLRNNGYNVKW